MPWRIPLRVPGKEELSELGFAYGPLSFRSVDFRPARPSPPSLRKSPHNVLRELGEKVPNKPTGGESNYIAQARSRNASSSFKVTGPGFPSPTLRSSTATIGST